MSQRRAFVEVATLAYVQAALWSSTDESGESLDRTYLPSDLTFDATVEATLDVARFVADMWPIVRNYEPNQVGHDFWLTRNRHGAGFWDGNYREEHGATLTSAAHEYPENYPFLDSEYRINFE